MSVEKRNKLVDKLLPCLTIEHPKEKEYIVKHGSFFRDEVSFFSDIDIRQILTIDYDFDFHSKFVKLLEKKCKNVYFINLKAGIKKEYFVGLGYFKKINSENEENNFFVINYYPDEIRKRILHLYNNKMISKEDYNRYTALVFNEPTLEQYILLNESLKDIYRLNWNKQEIINNQKDKNYKLDKGILKNKCMANFIIEIQPKFYMDVSNAFGFKLDGEFHLMNEEKNDSIFISYYNELVNKEYLKAIKRIYSILKFEAKKNPELNKEMIEKIRLFLNSDVNVLNLTKNYLKTLIVVYKNDIDSFKTFNKSKVVFLKNIKPVLEKDTYNNIQELLDEIKLENQMGLTYNEIQKSIDILSEKFIKKIVPELGDNRFKFEVLNGKINKIYK
jgi:hypothetical protein